MSATTCPECRTPAAGHSNPHCASPGCVWSRCTNCQAVHATGTGTWYGPGKVWGSPTRRIKTV